MDNTPDATLGNLAARQRGVFTTAQAYSCGFSPKQIEVRVRSGRWDRLARGVFRIRGAVTTWEQTALAAQLLRPGSLVSRLTAAALAGLDVEPPTTPTLLVPPGGSGRSPLATVHRSIVLPGDAGRLRGVPATTVPRTLVDCSQILTPANLSKLVDEAMSAHLATAGAVGKVLEALGTTRRPRSYEHLIQVLEVWSPSIQPESPSEARLIRLITSWGFPRPEPQIPIIDRDGVVIARIDGGWSRYKLGYEYDSVRWHGPAAWASDETRHAMIEGLGWRLLHIDKSDLVPGTTSLRDLLLHEWTRRTRQASA